MAAYNYPDWTEITGGPAAPAKFYPPVQTTFPLHTIQTSLKLEETTRLPFPINERLAWTKQERAHAANAQTPASLDEFSAMVSFLMRSMIASNIKNLVELDLQGWKKDRGGVCTPSSSYQERVSLILSSMTLSHCDLDLQSELTLSRLY